MKKLLILVSSCAFLGAIFVFTSPHQTKASPISIEKASKDKKMKRRPCGLDKQGSANNVSALSDRILRKGNMNWSSAGIGSLKIQYHTGSFISLPKNPPRTETKIVYFYGRSCYDKAIYVTFPGKVLHASVSSLTGNIYRAQCRRTGSRLVYCVVKFRGICGRSASGTFLLTVIRK